MGTCHLWFGDVQRSITSDCPSQLCNLARQPFEINTLWWSQKDYRDDVHSGIVENHYFHSVAHQLKTKWSSHREVKGFQKFSKRLRKGENSDAQTKDLKSEFQARSSKRHLPDGMSVALIVRCAKGWVSGLPLLARSNHEPSTRAGGERHRVSPKSSDPRGLQMLVQMHTYVFLLWGAGTWQYVVIPERKRKKNLIDMLILWIKQ